MWSEWRIDPTLATIGNVEKSHQQRSRYFVVLTYWKYAPRVKIAAALLDDFFDHSRRLLALKSSRVYTGFFVRNIQLALKRNSGDL